jgi:hypothetical protein
MAKAIDSFLDTDGMRCVDIILNADGSFTFKEFRRDAEDRGGWTLVHDYSALMFISREDALRGAREAIGWLREQDAGAVGSNRTE